MELPRAMGRPRRALRLLLLLCAAVLGALVPAGIRAADDDFTDIPELDDPPAPGPPAPRPPPLVPSVRPPGPGDPGPAAGPARDRVQRYEAGRHQAFTDRVLTLTACGRNLWGGDSRRSHALVADGDAWLGRGDGLWLETLRTGDPAGMDRALRELAAAHGAYLAARTPPPLRYSAKDSPRPRPFPSAYPSEEHPGPGMGRVVEEEKEPWRRHDELPLDEPSRFESDPHW